MGEPTRRSIAIRIEEARVGRGEDRVAVVELPSHTLIVVADAAGGVAGGADAAEAVCGALTDEVNDWANWLGRRDSCLAENGTGMAAAVALSITDDGSVHGASVGDCEGTIIIATDGLWKYLSRSRIAEIAMTRPLKRRWQRWSRSSGCQTANFKTT